jgi:tetratricopeptide (TPR) repeat protein
MRTAGTALGCASLAVLLLAPARGEAALWGAKPAADARQSSPAKKKAGKASPAAGQSSTVAVESSARPVVATGSDETDLARAAELRVEGKRDAALELLRQVEARTGATPEARAEAIYQQGIVLEDKGELGAATERYDTVVRTVPGAAAAGHAQLSLARVLARAGREDQAIEAATLLLRMYPRLGCAALVTRGGLNARAGRQAEAARDYRDAVRNFPNAPEARQAGEALAALCGDILGRPSSATAFADIMTRGECLMDSKRYAEARGLYEAAMKRKPPAEEQAEYLLAQGRTYEGEDRYGAAEKAYRRVVAAVPGTGRAASAQMAIVQMHLDRGKLRDAIRELERIARAYPGPQAAQAYFMIGSCQEMLRDPRKAEDAYRKAIDAAPQSPWSFDAQQSLLRLMEHSR